MPITELNHFLLVAKDLERTKDFYCRVLGMEVDKQRPDFGFPGYWLKANGDTCVHLASQKANEVRERIQKNKVEMHFRSFPEAKPPLFQIFLKDPDDVTIELNFLGEKVNEKDWQGGGAASAMTLKKEAGKKTKIAQH